jgi:hypothetical protein
MRVKRFKLLMTPHILELRCGVSLHNKELNVMHRVELQAGVTLNRLRPGVWCGGKFRLKLGEAFHEGGVK